MGALAKLGMHASPLPTPSVVAYPTVENTKDYFVERDGQRFAGTHLLVDMWGARSLDNPQAIEEALATAAVAAGATVLYKHFHHFEPNGGVSGVVVLAESHISIHSWPERSYAAIDIFMCGECDPRDALPLLKQAFTPDRMEVAEHRRGVFPEPK